MTKSFDEYQKSDNAICMNNDYNRMIYEAGQQSRQAEIENLQKRVKDLELINFDSELHFDAAKEHIDLLQKRIDLALDHTTNHGGYDDLTHIINILKGDTK